MDEVTFRSDTVLSDVHLYTPNHRHLMVRLNGEGQPVFLSQFKLLCADSGRDAEEPPPARTPSDSACQARADPSGQEGPGAQLDEDGDLDVVRRPQTASDPDPARHPRDKVHPTILGQEGDSAWEEDPHKSSPHCLIQIEHTMATPLEDVGKQVWRGALLLADYILARQDVFHGRTVLELGAGMGLVSIVAATVASTVYCTDVGADLLAMCQQNINLNSPLMAPAGGTVKVRTLDWLEDELCTDPAVPFSWSEEDVSDLLAHTTILLAAEVFYEDELTDALFRTLVRLAGRLGHTCTAILSVEKRLNFTLKHLDVTCEAYDHFRAVLRGLETRAHGPLRFSVQPIAASFPQRLVYERIPQLELWEILMEPVT